jgi:hypothetical protein
MFSASGGLAYHLLALKSQKRWLPYTIEVKRLISIWLQSLPRQTKQIILVGHSGGYSLPVNELKKFELICIDTDVLSHSILNFKLHQKFTSREQDRHYTTDWFVAESVRNDPSNPFIKLLREHPNAAICFCNIWGQIGVISKDAENILALWDSQLKQEQKIRSWFSYHDRYSADLNQPESFKTTTSNKKLSLSELKELYFENAKAVINDHLTEAIFHNQPNYVYLNWNLKRRTYHLIEVCCETSS